MRNKLRFLFALLFLVFIAVSCADIQPAPYPLGAVVNTNNTTPYDLDIPVNMPPMAIPEDNPMTVEGVALGRKLFYDPILSNDSTQSCGSCHAQAYGFTDSLNRWSVGIDGLEGDKNAMAIINLGYASEFFWDGRSIGMEAQAREPVINPIEMHDTWDNVEDKLNAHDTYPALFEEIFGSDPISEDMVVKVIAQFERTLISGNSEYDKFLRQEPNSFGNLELEGLAIFNDERGDCFHCHPVSGGLFTDHDYRNNGLDSVFDPENYGRFDVTGDTLEKGAFKTPTLRNIALTAPYMHDGRFQTLEEVLDHYSEGVVASASIHPTMYHQGRGLNLNMTQAEKDALIAFLNALTDTTFLNNPEFADPNL